MEMTVLQVCAYGADYPGNFIASLTALEQALAEKGISTIYAFVGKAADKVWCKEICKRTRVYFLPEARARILPETYRIFRRIYRENHVDIIHSHFELYDIPATVTAPRNARIFWHLHDPIQIHTGLRSLLWRLQYGVVSKRAHLLSVADHYRQAVIKLGFPADQTTTVLNSIDLNRVREQNRSTEKCFDFLSFGWDFYRKGDDLILKACQKLEKEGYSFRLLLNGNEKTWPELDRFLEGSTPAWLVRGDPVTDISGLFDQSRIFIQASRRETFSYAVCEAAYAGMPVISSDIAGLEWAHALPSVLFFPGEDWQQLYLCMKQCLTGYAPDDAAAQKSRQLIRDNYSLAAWAAKIMEQYQV